MRQWLFMDIKMHSFSSDHILSQNIFLVKVLEQKEKGRKSVTILCCCFAGQLVVESSAEYRQYWLYFCIAYTVYLRISAAVVRILLWL